MPDQTTPNQNPEQIARDNIDRMLVASGWAVQDKTAIDFHEGKGQAVREFPTDTGPADYVLFVDSRPVGYVVISSQSFCTNQGFKSLIPANGVFNEYVYFYLKSIRGLANSLATGTTFKELSGKAFAKLPVPLSPLNEQKRIVEKIEELFSELDAGEESLKKAQKQLGTYRQSILRKAFSGQLVPQDPNDEPASILLERIRKEREESGRHQKKAVRKKAP